MLWPDLTRDGKMANKYGYASANKHPKYDYEIANVSENEEDPGAYLDNLSNDENFGSKLPRNILAGLASLGHKTINTPHDLIQNIEQQGNQFGSMVNKNLNTAQYDRPPKESSVEKFNRENNVPEELKNPLYNQSIGARIPHQEDKNFAQMLGQKGEGTLADTLIQKGIEYAPEILTGKALLKGGISRLKGTHQLNKVEKFAKEQGLLDFEYPQKMIQDARKFLPKTEATKELLDQVRTGDYKAAFKLQSQIGHHQRQLSKSPLASENSIMAPKAGELKQNMLNHLEGILRVANHHEEADLLKSGINNFRQYKKVLNAAMPVIKYLGIPSSILMSLGFAFKKGKKLLKD